MVRLRCHLRVTSFSQTTIAIDLNTVQVIGSPHLSEVKES